MDLATVGWHRGDYNGRSGYAIFSLLDRYLLLRDAPENIPCVWFSPVKVEDPQLVIGSDYLEFTSFKKERVRVSWAQAL